MRRWPAGLVVLLAIPFATAGCGDAGGPNLHGDSYFTVAVDGTPWVPDTVGGILFGVTPEDGSLSLFASRVTPDQEQTVSLSIEGFPRTGTVPLSGIPGAAVGAYGIIQLNVPPPPPIVTFLSVAQPAGQVHITGLSRSDSVVTGSFTFIAATTPDTAPHHTVSGRFRIRYTFQQIFPPGGP